MNVKIEHEIHIKVDKDVKTCRNPAAICSEATMRKRLLTAALALTLLSAPALALTLSEARQQGRGGETLNGHSAPLRQDKETLALVKQINAARSESYSSWRMTTICRWMR